MSTTDRAWLQGTANVRLANEAWEALLRAQVLLERELVAEGTWEELTAHEYDVLYTVAKAPEGLNMAEINREVLVTQGGISRLVAGLVERGLLARCPDPRDGRAVRLTLTEAGRDLQKVVGRRHAVAVADAMNVLSVAELETLRELSRKLTAGKCFPPSRRTQS